MYDQACKLREIAGSAVPVARPKSLGVPVIAVSGARPGVGTTTVAVNLAAVLADLGERIVLVDASERHSNLARVAGVAATNEIGQSQVIGGPSSAGSTLVPGPAGIMVLVARDRKSISTRQESRTAAVSVEPRVSPTLGSSRHAQQRLLSDLQSLDEVASAIVIDAGAGLTPWIERFWLRATLVVLVTTPDDAAVIDAYAAIKRSTAVGVAADVRLLANQCFSDARARAAYGRLSAACRRFLCRELATLSPLPMHVAELLGNFRAGPRVWESPHTPFGHAALWLGHAVHDVLAEREVAAGPRAAAVALPA